MSNFSRIFNNGPDNSSWGVSTAFFGTREHPNLRADFVMEMRQLSKLRHPCITTVMGAVISKTEEPLLVME